MSDTTSDQIGLPRANLIDIVDSLEDLRNRLVDLETLTHAAAQTLEYLPYLPPSSRSLPQLQSQLPASPGSASVDEASTDDVSGRDTQGRDTRERDTELDARDGLQNEPDHRADDRPDDAPTATTSIAEAAAMLIREFAGHDREDADTRIHLGRLQSLVHSAADIAYSLLVDMTNLIDQNGQMVKPRGKHGTSTAGERRTTYLVSPPSSKRDYSLC